MAHILLIDDDDLLRDTLQQLLELDGHRVSAVADGALGLQRFRAAGSDAFDLVITDMLLPGADGAQVIVELRRVTTKLPIIAISGGRRVLTPAFNLETAALAGATRRLAKPFGRVELQSAVSQALAEAVR